MQTGAQSFLDDFLSFLVSLLVGKCTEALGFYSLLLLEGLLISVTAAHSWILDSSCRPHPPPQGARRNPILRWEK